MRTILHTLFLFLLFGCSTKVSNVSEDLTRMVALLSGKPATVQVSLSVKGQLKDKDGKPLKNTLLSQNSTGISSALKRQAVDKANALKFAIKLIFCINT